MTFGSTDLLRGELLVRGNRLFASTRSSHDGGLALALRGHAPRSASVVPQSLEECRVYWPRCLLSSAIAMLARPHPGLGHRVSFQSTHRQRYVEDPDSFARGSSKGVFAPEPRSQHSGHVALLPMLALVHSRAGTGRRSSSGPHGLGPQSLALLFVAQGIRVASSPRCTIGTWSASSWCSRQCLIFRVGACAFLSPPTRHVGSLRDRSPS